MLMMPSLSVREFTAIGTTPSAPSYDRWIPLGVVGNYQFESCDPDFIVRWFSVVTSLNIACPLRRSAGKIYQDIRLNF